ncbi:hypothetical protein CkaCkLH20_11369 [Colletotrichum karsti]|uniref:Uncharacterized protein n=1 Tax=Colletotrichum karsti TaxID=1095194 RepID=A0A9P6LG32_9PEZI|nr:uncharacterized protein CkaCkLH20_11369 [Colletotrichum karsti]KAF9871200.1 hypothetical protein CkaCkLH20_11369 [Colletotrichum karsti]
MKVSSTTIVAVLASLALANPVELEARADHAKVTTFSDNLCKNGPRVFEITGSGSKRCNPVKNARSIKVQDKRGCTIKTWSGSNCKGQSFKIPDGDLDCHSVLHASVQILC